MVLRRSAKVSLAWDLILAQTGYFHLANVLDWDMDGRSDVLIPLGDIDNAGKPRWMILRATGGKNDFTFEQIETNIPFDVVLGDTVTLADPRGPRIGDFDGNGSPDVALFLGNELHVFKNRAVRCRCARRLFRWHERTRSRRIRHSCPMCRSSTGI